MQPGQHLLSVEEQHVDDLISAGLGSVDDPLEPRFHALEADLSAMLGVEVTGWTRPPPPVFSLCADRDFRMWRK